MKIVIKLMNPSIMLSYIEKFPFLMAKYEENSEAKELKKLMAKLRAWYPAHRACIRACRQVESRMQARDRVLKAAAAEAKADAKADAKAKAEARARLGRQKLREEMLNKIIMWNKIRHPTHDQRSVFSSKDKIEKKEWYMLKIPERSSTHYFVTLESAIDFIDTDTMCLNSLWMRSEIKYNDLIRVISNSPGGADQEILGYKSEFQESDDVEGELILLNKKK